MIYNIALYIALLVVMCLVICLLQDTKENVPLFLSNERKKKPSEEILFFNHGVFSVASSREQGHCRRRGRIPLTASFAFYEILVKCRCTVNFMVSRDEQIVVSTLCYEQSPKYIFVTVEYFLFIQNGNLQISQRLLDLQGWPYMVPPCPTFSSVNGYSDQGQTLQGYPWG